VTSYAVSMTDQISGSLLQDVELAGLDDMKLTLGGGTTTTLAGGAKIDSDSHVTLEPLTTTSTVDLKPVTVDACVRLELGTLPATDVHTPYEQRWAVEFLGVELFALKVSGETTTSVRPAPRSGTVLDIERHSFPDHECGCGGRGQHTHHVVLDQ
jgi:hypothetical protein